MLKLRKILLFDYLYYIIFLIAIILFVANSIIKKQSVLNSNDNSFEGIVSSYKINGDNLSFILKSKEKIKCSYYVKTETEKNYYLANLKYGTKLKITGNLKEPINNTIPNTFNYKKYLYYQNIFYLLEIDQIEIISNKANVFYQVKNAINKYLLKFKNYDYLLAFIVGNDDYLDSEMVSNYQVLGASHLFAISGSNIVLFAQCLIFIFKKLKISENKRYYLVMLFLLFFCFLTNFSASVLRASLFFSLLSLNKIFYTHIKTINIYLLTLAILIFINPNILYDLGAQYSFVTSLGLILFNDKLNSKNYFISLIKISFISFLFSLPISALNFYELNLLSIVNNLILVPLISLIVYPTSLIVMFLPFLEFIFTILVNIMEWITVFLTKFNLSILIPKTGFIFWIIYYWLIIKYLKKARKSLLIVIILFLILNRYKSILDSNYYIYYLDVGQGDSSLLISPRSKEIIMIDTGGKLDYSKAAWAIKNTNFKISNNTIYFLKSLGINKIDLLIITHGDEDHAGEALNIINNIKVKNIMLNRNELNQMEKQIIKKSNIVEEYKSKYFDFKILNDKIYNDENKDSLITYFNINNNYFLYMGDAYKEQELELLEKYELKVDIIKLGHHGSKTSSDYNFLKTINPDLAIISSGRNNKFNHPSKETTANLNDLKIKYYNTQDKGTIKIKIRLNRLYYFFNPP